MSVLILLAVSMLPNLLGLQTPEKLAVSKVDRLCGKLVYVDQIRSKNDPEQIVEGRTKSLTKVVMRLYLRQENSACCERLSPVAEVVTGNWGHFNFKKIDAGQYWLVARWNGQEYKMAIRFEPTKRTNEDECFHFEYRINSTGQFWGGHDVVVD